MNAEPRPVPLLNRELSWLEFNRRVLAEALDPAVPLLERLRFVTIFYTNLDEFFMIRVSGLIHQLQSGVEVLSHDGLSPRAQIIETQQRLQPMLAEAQRVLAYEILPELEKHDVKLVDYDDITPTQRIELDRWFDDCVLPILTPLAVGPTLPFPFISNLSLNLGVLVRDPEGEQRFARIKIPSSLPRFVGPPSIEDQLERARRLVPVEQIVSANLHKLFPGMEVGTAVPFRVTRDADVEISEDEADDLLKVLEEQLRKRRFGAAVRLEVQAGGPPEVLEALRQGLEVAPWMVYPTDGYLSMNQFSQLCSLDLPPLKFPPFVPRMPEAFLGEDPVVAIRAGDQLVHHPFDSFSPVVDFIRSAAADPDVVAIKQTLYRTSGDSPVIAALEQAIEAGKQVAVLVELKARFDEENNITWARRLEETGVHVVYGVKHLKTHCKLAMVVRREEVGLRRYAHIATGNYNDTTARIYTDLGIFTCDEDLTADVAEVFNTLTGFSRPEGYRRLLVAPRYLKPGLLERIGREADLAREGKPARLRFKCNAITDIDIIEGLYAASQAGVKIELLVRGICCLVPGVAGVSDNITVRSVVGRFLEHSRIYWFGNDGSPEVFIGSADLMDRNLIRRVEVCTPILDPRLRNNVTTLLDAYDADVNRTWKMRADGSYLRPRGEGGLDIHQQLMP